MGEATEKKPIVRFEDVSKIYPNGAAAVEHITLSIMPGEFVSLVGASGAGKSTLLKLIYAEEQPTEGTVFFNERALSSIKQKLLPFYRRNIGTIFQDFKLLPQKTAFENVAYALEVDGKSAKDIQLEVTEILDIVGLKHKLQCFPRELSGGEQQRVAVARALIHHPKVICADEPTGNLDPFATKEMLDLLLEINSYGTTIIIATHKKESVDTLNRRVITLSDGKLLSDEKRGKYVLKN